MVLARVWTGTDVEVAPAGRTTEVGGVIIVLAPAVPAGCQVDGEVDARPPRR